MVMRCSPTKPDGPEGPNWYTASSGASPDPTPHELSALQEHLRRCRAMRGRLFHLRRRTDSVLDFAAARLITTVLALLLLAGLLWLL